MKIFLLGLPGSGKTTLGKELSAALTLPFVDLDFEIESDAKKKITEIFEEFGEIHFRKLESRTLSAWCQSPSGFVMATGGGTPCFLENMSVINQSGKSVFLDVSVESIAERMQHDELQERPLLASLQSGELSDRIRILRSNRIQFYEQAQVRLSGNDITAEKIIKALGGVSKV